MDADSMTEAQESNFNIATLTLIRINEICKKLDLLAVSNLVRNPSYVRVHYAFLKSFYNNMRYMIPKKERTKWDEVFFRVQKEVFSPQLDQRVFDWLDKIEVDLREMQQKIGFSVTVRPKIDMKRKISQKLVGSDAA